MIYRLKYLGLCRQRFLRYSFCQHYSTLPKDVSTFPDKFDSTSVEKGWYDYWDTIRRTTPKKGPVFSMILPPPNVTGHLHLGHALTATVQDSLARWHRMKGYDTVWVPGCDHAGIATQVVVEKWIKATEKIKRQDIGRDEFIKRVWQWKDSKGTKIFDQLRRMGATMDWEKETFTMSPNHNKAVNEAFRILLQKKLIYRGNYLVHWSPALGSVLSDIEVDHVEVEGGKQYLNVPSGKALVGQMFDIDYCVEGSSKNEVVTISTTRPETLLGDVAVAVHPQDDRYADLLNRKVMLKHPLRLDSIPLVADEAADPEKGTGAVKITPSHDANDFAVGQRLGLPSITVLDENGLMCFPVGSESRFQLTSDGQSFLSLPRFVARLKMLEFLGQKGLLRQTRDHGMSVPVCSRTGDIVEPLPRPQWFLRMKEAYSAALRFSETNELNFFPPSHQKVWHHWLQTPRDWCISRQLWWGHQIPMWRIEGDPCEADHVDEDGNSWVFGSDLDEAKSKVNCNLVQDQDVLDTWFSSALLPLSTFGWPDQSVDSRYYPLSLMETGHDILFFWVARMVMMSHMVTDSLPFEEVMLHGIVCDAKGKKMSKSLGNVVDPMHIIEGASREALEMELGESKAKGSLSGKDYPKAVSSLRKDFPAGIPKCGADALRYGLCINDVSSAQINLDVTTIKTSAAFCNKIWQASRFLLMAQQRKPQWRPKEPSGTGLSLSDRWILDQCAQTVKAVNGHWSGKQFHLLTRSLRHFMYSCLCDVYVEATKSILNEPNHPQFDPTLETLFTCLTTGLRLLHPLMPFLTEELHQRLHSACHSPCQSIMIEPYPLPETWQKWVDPEVTHQMEACLEMNSAIRAIKTQYGLSRRHLPEVLIMTEKAEMMRQSAQLIQTLAPCGHLEVTESCAGRDLSRWCDLDLPTGRLHVKLEGLVDVQREMKRISQRLCKLEKEGGQSKPKKLEEMESLRRQQQLLQSLL